jgi:hypothetical protein
MKETKRCSKCILPETFPGIFFNDEGVCNFCTNHKNALVIGEAQLKKVLHAERGRIYDCLVPISGGKDSSYVLYYATEILNLNTIAVNYDSGFQSDIARKNIVSICNRLKVPLVVKRADLRTQVKMLREVLRISEIVGTFFHICMNCEVNIRTSALNTAKENHIPFILYGDSAVEAIGIQPFLGRKAFLNQIPRTSLLRLLLHTTKYSWHSVRQRIGIKVPIRNRFQPMGGSVTFPEQRPKVVHFFDYIEWDTIDKISFLRQKLGWKSPSNQETNRFDCSLHCFGNHHWLQKCGISVDGFTYSTMIRCNRMKREEAILREKVVRERVQKDCLETIEKIGLKGYRLPTI